MASGDTLLVFTPLHNEPPATNYATLDLRNGHPVLDFDATTKEAAIFSAVMPRHYGGGGITAYLHYAMSTATTGDIDWDGNFERIGDQQQDIDSDGFVGANSVDTTTVPAASGDVDIVQITFTNGADMDSIAVGESFRFKVERDSPNDSATGDAELLAVELKET